MRSLIITFLCILFLAPQSASAFLIQALGEISFLNLVDNQVITADVFSVSGKASAANIAKVEVSLNGKWQTAECLNVNCSEWKYSWVIYNNGIHFIKARVITPIGEISTPIVMVYVKKEERFSASKSSILINKEQAYAGLGDSIVVLVTARSISDTPVENKAVTLNWASVDKQFGSSAQGITNEDGQVAFNIKSKQAGQFKIEAEVGGAKIDQVKLIKFLEAPENFTDGQLIKSKENTAVYFLDKNNIRHPYPTQAIYESYWGNNFTAVKVISVDELAKYEMGKSVPFKAGTLMKVPSINKVYRVGDNGTIQWITTEALATKMYGLNWAKLVKDLPEICFLDYKVIEPITG
ncbi:MAG: Ig-like domain-containing protein [Candidatus Falkowbacteria bacterium]